MTTLGPSDVRLVPVPSACSPNPADVILRDPRAPCDVPFIAAVYPEWIDRRVPQQPASPVFVAPVRPKPPKPPPRRGGGGGGGGAISRIRKPWKCWEEIEEAERARREAEKKAPPPPRPKDSPRVKAAKARMAAWMTPEELGRVPAGIWAMFDEGRVNELVVYRIAELWHEHMSGIRAAFADVSHGPQEERIWALVNERWVAVWGAFVEKLAAGTIIADADVIADPVGVSMPVAPLAETDMAWREARAEVWIWIALGLGSLAGLFALGRLGKPTPRRRKPRKKVARKKRRRG